MSRDLKISSHNWRAVSSSRSLDPTAASNSLYPGGDNFFSSSSVNFFSPWFSSHATDCPLHFLFFVEPSLRRSSVISGHVSSVFFLDHDRTFACVVTGQPSSQATRKLSGNYNFFGARNGEHILLPMVVLSATTKYSSDEIKHALLKCIAQNPIWLKRNSLKKMHQKNRPDIPVFNNNFKKPFMTKELRQLLSF